MKVVSAMFNLLRSQLMRTPKLDRYAAHSRARKLMLSGDVDEALKLLTIAVRDWPDDWWLVGQMGSVLGEMERHTQAIPLLKRAVFLNPSAGEIHYNLGEVLRRISDLDGAIREFKAALRCGCKHETVHYGLGHALLSQGSTQDGLDHLIEALRINPIHQPTLEVLSRLGPFFGGVYRPESIEDVQKIKAAMAKARTKVIFV